MARNHTSAITAGKKYIFFSGRRIKKPFQNENPFPKWKGAVA
jgi:hypothetical protein